ncbi:MazG nucleotide pyrophosphohydrolase domain-containing protein [Gracilibacillus alcaliphilus]|uniref:MazG nucleotide pyrophosphohydrolase domain-containing protein n=1 Tax=Gracilibacillus alcaliphilus TaxID=1401441 RepID=UPI0019585B3D|nr:MazG nucleotide pyrophosphohydrolase domain-containing protein [Gracilibacillus alcaliphilus]MBM7679093.1 NTP pyrophosphatase (non-canonical NTP hydrolase) [Gracilibacillus alcaliphilus]
MKELQQFAKQYHQEMNWEISNETYEQSKASLLQNYMLLTTEVAEVAEELRKAFTIAHKKIEAGADPEEAFTWAKQEVKEDISKEFADCLAYMLKFVNYFEIDLEDSFYKKMAEVKQRKHNKYA